LEIVGFGRRKVSRSWFGQDKGHAEEWKAFTHAILQGGGAPISFKEIVATTLATLRVLDSCSSGEAQLVDVEGFVESNSQPTHHRRSAAAISAAPSLR
jgi:hypothetical protein